MKERRPPGKDASANIDVWCERGDLVGRELVERLVNSNLNASSRCGVDVRLTVRRAAQYGTLRSRWTGVECRRFIDFEDEEEVSERDAGAHGIVVIHWRCWFCDRDDVASGLTCGAAVAAVPS